MYARPHYRIPAVHLVVGAEVRCCQIHGVKYCVSGRREKQSLLKDAKEHYIMKRRILTIALVLAGVAGVLAVAHLLVPPILKSERHALLSGHMLLISMKNRESSDLITFPVDYLREGNSVYVGSDSAWWKHLEGGAEVRLLIQGTEFVGWATPIIDDPNRSQAGFKKLRPWTYKRALWSGAVFVEIQIQESAG